MKLTDCFFWQERILLRHADMFCHPKIGSELLPRGLKTPEKPPQNS